MHFFCSSYLQRKEPFIRVIRPEEIWLYKYPSTKSYYPTYLLWTTIICVPGLVLTIDYMLRRNKKDLYEAILCLTLIYSLNGPIISYIKVLVGRPRPDFIDRCIPNDIKNNQINCTGDKSMEMEGRKSFPSGHASFAFCSMMFLSLYLAGKLQVFVQKKKVESWKFVICVLPLLLAATIAISRTCDYHHHWQGKIYCFIHKYRAYNICFLDVTVGGLLGCILAYFCYYLYFPSLTSNYSYLSNAAAQSAGIEN